MNDTQTIFAVFYAIFWGAVFSVSSRWKPFNFGLIFNKEVKHVTRRISLSLLILNILPILFFILILYILGLKGNLCSQQKKYWVEFSSMVLSGIIPAFGIFGFYRLYIGIIEYNPTKYYKYFAIPRKYREYCGKDNAPEPSLSTLGIILSHKDTWWRNIFFACFYIIFPGLGSVMPCTMFAIYIVLFIVCWIYNRDNLTSIIIIIISLILFISIYWLKSFNGIDIIYELLREHFPPKLAQSFMEMGHIRIISIVI